MNHADHVNLLRGGVPAPGGTWADFGSGMGAFTLALAELIGPGSVIHSIDRDAHALAVQAREVRRRFPQVTLHTQCHDYARPLALPPLDGIIAANTLHFQRDALPVVRLLKSYLKEAGRMIVVEYNIGVGNFAVPHPLPFTEWQRLAERCGFAHTELLATRPSRFLHQIYSAVSW
jgi:SAM-dependent methyltransferase